MACFAKMEPILKVVAFFLTIFETIRFVKVTTTSVWLFVLTNVLCVFISDRTGGGKGPMAGSVFCVDNVWNHTNVLLIKVTNHSSRGVRLLEQKKTKKGRTLLPNGRNSRWTKGRVWVMSPKPTPQQTAKPNTSSRLYNPKSISNTQLQYFAWNTQRKTCSTNCSTQHVLTVNIWIRFFNVPPFLPHVCNKK